MRDRTESISPTPVSKQDTVGQNWRSPAITLPAPGIYRLSDRRGPPQQTPMPPASPPVIAEPTDHELQIGDPPRNDESPQEIDRDDTHTGERYRGVRPSSLQVPGAIAPQV